MARPHRRLAVLDGCFGLFDLEIDVKNAELIARLKDADAEEVMTTPLCEDAADAIEALESQRDDLRSQVDSLNVGFNNCQKERDALQAEVDRLQAEVERLTMALHGNRVAIETAEESLKDRVALAMEVDRLSAAGVSHCGHRPPCIECSKYAAPSPQQPAPSVPEGWKLVPIEPTEAMLEVGFFAENDVFDSAKTKRIHVWKDMLAAAPQPKEQQ